MEIKFHGVHGGIRGYLGDGSCISVLHDNQAILIDCGSRQIVEDVMLLSQLEAILFSHTHWDHRSALRPILNKMNGDTILSGEKRTIRIYSPEHLNNLPKQSSNGSLFAYEVLNEIPSAVGPFKIESLRTNHHKKNYAYKISVGDKCLVYTGDTGLFDKLYDFCSRADALVVESTFLDPWKRWTEFRGHMIPEYAAKLADYAQPKHIIFTHYMRSGETFKREFMRHLNNPKIPVSVSHKGYSLML